mmetsp:Transcript_21888/g.63138  ORF Transcript_21888/g.63138 Transcript_21888/m.63138 type:complete len:278 (+) Transcript_21888:160-993(+)
MARRGSGDTLIRNPGSSSPPPVFHWLQARCPCVVPDNVLVVLRVQVGQPLPPIVLHPGGVGRQIHVQHLCSHELEGKQGEACRSQWRLHPVPRPATYLQDGLEILWGRYICGHKHAVEPHGNALAEDHWNAANARDEARCDAHLVRQGGQPDNLAVLRPDLRLLDLGCGPVHRVDAHDVPHQALGAGLMAALLSEHNQRVVRHLAHGHGHRPRVLQRGDTQALGACRVRESCRSHVECRPIEAAGAQKSASGCQAPGHGLPAWATRSPAPSGSATAA